MDSSDVSTGIEYRKPYPSGLYYQLEERSLTLEDLKSSAANFGVVFSDEKDEYLGGVVVKVEPLFKIPSQHQQALSLITGSTASTYTLWKALRPIDFGFEDQHVISTRLEALATLNKSLKLKCQEFTLLAKMQLFRLKKHYNSVAARLWEESVALDKDFDDLQTTKEVREYSHDLKCEEEEYRRERGSLKSAIDLSQDDSEKLELKKQLSAKAKAHLAILADLQSKIFNEGKKPLDIDAINEAKKRISAHYKFASEKLAGIRAEIKPYQEVITALVEPTTLYHKREAKCNRDSRFAKLLATLEGPLEFFEFPPEVRNLVYKELLQSNETLLITTFTNPRARLQGYRHVRGGKYQLQTHKFFSTSLSRQFRDEAMTYYYACNSFTCGSLWDMEKDLGLKLLKPKLRDSLSTFFLAWTSLGESTVKAVELLTALPALQAIDIYISWAQVMGSSEYDYTGNGNSIEGVESFKRLLNFQNPNLEIEVQIKVFSFAMSEQEEEDIIHPRFLVQQPYNLRGSFSAPLPVLRLCETETNELFTQRLILQKDNRNTPGPADPQVDPMKLMEKDEIDQKLEDVIALIQAKGHRALKKATQAVDEDDVVELAKDTEFYDEDELEDELESEAEGLGNEEEEYMEYEEEEEEGMLNEEPEGDMEDGMDADEV